MQCINQTTLKSSSRIIISPPALATAIKQHQKTGGSMTSSRRCHLPNNQIVKDQTRRSSFRFLKGRSPLKPACYSGEKARKNKRFLAISNPSHLSLRLGLTKVGKSKFTTLGQPRQHHRQKNHCNFLTDWNLASHHLLKSGKPPASNAESSDSFVRV